jgi:hypothetical protein
MEYLSRFKQIHFFLFCPFYCQNAVIKEE